MTQIRPLEDLTKDELIALIQREREQYEAVGAGGVSLMGDAKDAEIARLHSQIDKLLAHCPDGECFTCSEIICPHGEPLHFHHDGCPACAALSGESK